MPNESRICRIKKKNSVAGKFAAVKYWSETETYSLTQKLNREDYGVDKYQVLLAIVKGSTMLKNNIYCCVHLTNLIG